MAYNLWAYVFIDFPSHNLYNCSKQFLLFFDFVFMLIAVNTGKNFIPEQFGGIILHG